MSNKFTATVTKKGKKFAHVITDESGKVVGTRSSNKTYKFAAVVQRSLASWTAHYRSCLNAEKLESQRPFWMSKLEGLPKTQEEMEIFVLGYSNKGSFPQLNSGCYHLLEVVEFAA